MGGGPIDDNGLKKEKLALTPFGYLLGSNVDRGQTLFYRMRYFFIHVCVTKLTKREICLCVCVRTHKANVL